MAVIILTDNHVHPIPVQIGTALILLGILLVAALFMLASGPILRLIGNSGSSILIRVMGMILAALSVEFVLDGLGISGLVAGG
jgi:multiple antibiotic resistance protein